MYIFLVALALFFAIWELRKPRRRTQAFAGYIGHFFQNMFLFSINQVFFVSIHHWLPVFPGASWNLPMWLRGTIIFLAIDLQLYLWHRANHRFEFLWRFHRVHHSDDEMNFSTAFRFHLGELIPGAIIFWVLASFLSMTAEEGLVVRTMTTAVVLFHHSNISTGSWDSYLRRLIITPEAHEIHHSETEHETNSNYGVFLSIWDRLGGTHQESRPVERLGLREFPAEKWGTIAAMLWMPFVVKSPR